MTDQKKEVQYTSCKVIDLETLGETFTEPNQITWTPSLAGILSNNSRVNIFLPECQEAFVKRAIQDENYKREGGYIQIRRESRYLESVLNRLHTQYQKEHQPQKAAPPKPQPQQPKPQQPPKQPKPAATPPGLTEKQQAVIDAAGEIIRQGQEKAAEMERLKKENEALKQKLEKAEAKAAKKPDLKPGKGKKSTLEKFRGGMLVLKAKGLKTDEIAAVFDCSVKTVYNILHEKKEER